MSTTADTAVLDPFGAIVAREGSHEEPPFGEYLAKCQHEINLVCSLIDTVRTVLARVDHRAAPGLESVDGTLQVAELLCSQISEALDSVTIRKKFQGAPRGAS